MVFLRILGSSFKAANHLEQCFKDRDRHGGDFSARLVSYSFHFNNNHVGSNVYPAKDGYNGKLTQNSNFPMILTDSEKYTPAETHEQHTPNSIKYTENKTENKSKLPLILGLTLGLGLPILLVISYFIYKKYKK